MSTTAPPDQPPDPPTLPPSPPAYRTTAATNIDRLNKIHEVIPKMLKYFAAALTQLTTTPIDTPTTADPNNPSSTLTARKEAFRKNTIFCGLSVDLIRSELVKQIQELEKHRVIPKSQPKFMSAGRQGEGGGGKAGVKEEGEVVDPGRGVRNGGYGDFDVGVLNARASSGRVGEEDVLERVRVILEELGRLGGEERMEGDEDEEMADG